MDMNSAALLGLAVWREVKGLGWDCVLTENTVAHSDTWTCSRYSGFFALFPKDNIQTCLSYMANVNTIKMILPLTCCRDILFICFLRRTQHPSFIPSSLLKNCDVCVSFTCPKNVPLPESFWHFPHVLKLKCNIGNNGFFLNIRTQYTVNMNHI